MGKLFRDNDRKSAMERLEKGTLGQQGKKPLVEGFPNSSPTVQPQSELVDAGENASPAATDCIKGSRGIQATSHESNEELLGYSYPPQLNFLLVSVPDEIRRAAEFGQEPNLLISPENVKFANQLILDMTLLAGIRARDLTKVLDAIKRGANVNNSANIDTYNTFQRGGPGETLILPSKKPLALALELGFDDIALVLQQNGAKL